MFHTILFLFISYFHISSASIENNKLEKSGNSTESFCEPIHSQTHGVNLICCSIDFPLIENCEYGHLCNDKLCKCSVELSADLDCEDSLDVNPFEWRDHRPSSSPLPCSAPNFPSSGFPYTITVKKWNNLTTSFLSGMCDLNVTSVIFLDLGLEISTVDLASCFPHLENLEFVLEREEPFDIYPTFRMLKHLRHLRVVNVDFEFWHNVSPWVVSIISIHIENSTMFELPKWLVKNQHLSRLFIKSTELTSVAAVSQLSHLKSAKLSHNQITDLKNVIFRSKELYDIDISHNQISSFSTHTFSQCSELRVLDLSHNPLQSLPHRAFQGNRRLKWLKLSHTQLNVLLPENFLGLSSLKTLSISRSPLQSISPFAFLPLKSLKSIDLEGTNLTKIPHAITQMCHLTHVNVANNLFHKRNSLPADVLALLSGLSQFRIDGNPLKEFPSGLLLISPVNSRLIRQIIHSMTILPVWTSDPCTPFYWNLHLRNSSSSLRQLVTVWDDDRMKQEGLEYCREQYDWMMDNQDIYRDLERNSGCSVSRRLRSSASRVLQTCDPPSQEVNVTAKSVSHQNIVKSPHHVVRQHKKSIDRSLKAPLCRSVEQEHTYNLLVISICLNVFFLVLSFLIACLCWFGGKRNKYNSY